MTSTPEGQLGRGLGEILGRLSSGVGMLPAMMFVAFLASVNFLGGLGDPPHSIWDESYYVTAVQRYEQGTAQFASHPPLALMLITAGDLILHPNRNLDTRSVGAVKSIGGDKLPPNYSFAGVRFAPGVFAVVGAVLFFLIMMRLTGSVVAALVFSNLYVFENAFVTHFRAAHLDPFQIAFVLAAILCFVIGVQRGRRGSFWVDFALGASVGLSMMVKLNSGVLLILGMLLILYRLVLSWPRRSTVNGKSQAAGARTAEREGSKPAAKRGRAPEASRGAAAVAASDVAPAAVALDDAPQAQTFVQLLVTAVREGVVVLVGCFAAVALVFTVHVAVGPHAPDPANEAGGKDTRFITPVYGAYLHGQRSISPAVVWDASRDYLRFIGADYDGMTRSDANGSPPLLWPLHWHAINYRWDSDGTYTSYVQLTGNLWSWFLALLAPFATIILLALQWRRPCEESQPHRRALMLMLLIQYAVYMVIHAYLGMHRVMYLYHYFIALLIAYCLIPLVLAELADRWPALKARQTLALGVMTALLLGCFTFYAPLNLHRPLTHAQCEWRNVLQHVVACR